MVLRVALIATVVSILLNLVVPHLGLGAVKITSPYFPQDSFLSKLEKMFQFHVNHPVVTSLVVALLVFLSVVITFYIPM